MIAEALEAGFLIGDFIYHRFLENNSQPTPKPAHDLTIPRVEAGAPYPLLYGRCRVQAPILAWISQPLPVTGASIGDTNTPFVYTANMLFILGIPFDNPGASRLRAVWSGDMKLADAPPGLTSLTGNGGISGSTECQVETPAALIGGAGKIGGFVEFLNGNNGQSLYSGGVANTYAATSMAAASVDYTLVPGYRGFLSAFLFNSGQQWWIGADTNVPAYSFEVDSLPSNPLGPNAYVNAIDGGVAQNLGDANPIDVLFDLFTGVRGKCNLPSSYIDLVSWKAAATTLDTEGNGFSRSWENGTPVRDMVNEIMTQIDGVLYEDPLSGLIKIKLVRADYQPSQLLQINPTNAVEIQNFSMGGWTAIPNKVRVTYSNRNDDYRHASSPAQSLGNAVAQNGETREINLQMPGVCSAGLALSICGRELSARSRPLRKCRAIVDRTFRNIVPGDVVRLSWPQWQMTDVVFRVASANRGTMENQTIALDLIEDYFYVWRNYPPRKQFVHGFSGGATFGF